MSSLFDVCCLPSWTCAAGALAGLSVRVGWAQAKVPPTNIQYFKLQSYNVYLQRTLQQLRREIVSKPTETYQGRKIQWQLVWQVNNCGQLPAVQHHTWDDSSGQPLSSLTSYPLFSMQLTWSPFSHSLSLCKQLSYPEGTIITN